MKFVVSLFALALLSSTAAAVPVLYCKDGGIDLVADGCISGTTRHYPGGGDGIYSNTGGGDPEAAVEAAILGATGSAVDIKLYGKSDVNPALFSFSTMNLTSSQNGTWTVLDGTLISYITIKAANSFALYEISPTASTGSYTTAGIINNGGSQPNVSHISFWTLTGTEETEIPEPATAALSILGLGAASRLRKKFA